MVDVDEIKIQRDETTGHFLNDFSGVNLGIDMIGENNTGFRVIIIPNDEAKYSYIQYNRNTAQIKLFNGMNLLDGDYARKFDKIVDIIALLRIGSVGNHEFRFYHIKRRHQRTIGISFTRK